MKRIILCVFLFLLFVFLYHIPPTLTPSYAQTSGTCSTSNTKVVVQNGLTSTTSINNNLVTSSGICIIDPKAAFAPYKVLSYDELKSLYFDQYKGPAIDKAIFSGNAGEGDLSNRLAADKKLIHVTGYVGMNGTIAGTKTGVVFVEGKLNLTPPLTQFTYGDGNSGIVFVVKGNVNIDPAITRIDAVIISEGTICTTADFTDPANPTCPTADVSTTSSGAPISALTINGSLISLNESAPIKFKRSLDRTAANNNNTTPAEIINHQVKYLVILRSLMSDTFQRWSEIP